MDRTRRIHALVTGPPGIGKTTLVKRIAACLKNEHDIALRGFYTEEVRKTEGRGEGTRVGFDVVTFSGSRAPLARVGSAARFSAAEHRRPCVGKYQVDVASFEKLALPALAVPIDRGASDKSLVVVDEVGKMELFSADFVASVRALFDNCRFVVLGTIPIASAKSLWLVEELRQRGDCQLYEVTELNRETLVKEISAFILASLHHSVV